jgi:hypothetical protein
MKPAPPEGGIPRLASRLPGLARRSRRLAATVTAGSPLEVTVRDQGRRYQGQVYHPGTGRKWRFPLPDRVQGRFRHRSRPEL